MPPRSSPRLRASPARKAPASPAASPRRAASPSRRSSSPKAASPPKKKAASDAPVALGWFNAMDIVVVAGAALAWDHVLRKAGMVPAKLSFDCVNDQAWLGVAAVAAASHAMYYYIWNNPAKWAAACKEAPLSSLGANAVEVFNSCCLGLKAAQQLALVCWAAGGTSSAAIQSLLRAASNEQWALFALLAGGGQVLNVAIYNAIGKDGVYYGFKLGRPVPWCRDFPFNVGFRHPQYVGSILSQLGMMALLATKANMAAGLLQLAIYWVGLYALTSIQEASGDNDKPKKKK